MIIVSNLDHAEAAYKKYAPDFVVSILDPADPAPPVFETLPSGHHVKLDRDCAREENAAKGEGRCEKLIALAARWRQTPEPRPAILIHCHQGAARSMAVAYILMCAIEKDCAETDIAQRLRDAAPHADPNLMLVSEADALLGRNDRMVEAVLDLSPSCTAVNQPIIALPVAA